MSKKKSKEELLFIKYQQKVRAMKNIQLNKERIEKCFGNCMMPLCTGHHDCEEYTGPLTTTSEGLGCLQVTNERHGVCECKYKRYCHTSRQQGQVNQRKHSFNTLNGNKVYETVEECWFYQEHKKQDISEGIGGETQI